jgi:twinkle protein
MRFFDCKTKINSDGKPVSIGFRYFNGSYKVRSLSEKDFHSIGEIAKGGLYGKDRFTAGSHKYCTITEGEHDAHSYWQVLHSPVVSIQSAATAVRDCSLDRDWLSSFERIYIAFDNDAAGKEALKRVAKLFDYNKIYIVRLELKDPNEYLQQGKEQELRNIWWNAKKYRPETILSSLSEFKNILISTIPEGIPYPFDTLNSMTYGIRTSESVLITAQEGVGKTEFCHAIEHKILKETDYGVAAIYLEEPKQRHLQALAGIELRKPVHIPDCDCSTDQVIAALEKVVRVDDRLCIYSHYGSDDPDVLADTIRFLVTVCGCRIVILDHITMAVSGSAGDDERKQLDYLDTRLEMMVKELDYALLKVSHVNDEGQTRGSRLLSKNADIRIDLKRDILADNDIERNTTSLFVSKNRFSGKTGYAGSIYFDPITHTYREAANDNIRGFNDQKVG